MANPDRHVKLTSGSVTLAGDVNIAGDVDIVAQGVLTDRSGTIDDDGMGSPVATEAMAANANRRYLLIQNPHASDSLWVHFGGTATAASPSIELFGGVAATIVFEGTFVTTQAISVIGASAGQSFTAWEG